MRKYGFLSALGLFVVGLGVYRFRRQIIGRWLDLPPLKYKVIFQRGLKIPMRDGISLAVDHYAPDSERLFPTILIRTPYGRGGSVGLAGLLSAFIAQRFAERGYNVIVQDVRGRFDSEGEFEPFLHEADDGRDTLEWIEKQPWFNGCLGMWGPSYLGYVQWAVATNAPLYLKALMPVISGSRISEGRLRDNALALDTILRWILELDVLEGKKRKTWLNLEAIQFRKQERILRKAFSHLPLSEADRVVVGKTVPFYQARLRELTPGPESSIAPILLKNVVPPVHLISGWYDIFLRETLDDYADLHSIGRKPYLTIGPWNHVKLDVFWESIRQGLVWFDAHLKGDRRRLREKPVRVYVMGANKWIDMDKWPPPFQEVRYFLDGNGSNKNPLGGILTSEIPQEGSIPDTYTYDPAHPTPSLGGAQMNFQAFQRDNRPLEARPDVLVYTSPPLPYDLEVMGSSRVMLFVRSSLAYTDFFARLCDVFPDGRSYNVSDGLVRLEPGRGHVQSDGSLQIQLYIWPTAYCFRRSHAIRLQVSSGAHPRWNRNLGTGESPAEGVRMLKAFQTVYHDATHPSELVLPVVNFYGGNF